MGEDDVREFLNSLNMQKQPGEPSQPPESTTPFWDDIILPKSSYLILGDIGTGKSGLAYWLTEKYSQEYHLRPATVLPGGATLPDNWEVLLSPEECTKMENAMVFIDEADLQLPMNDFKMRDVVLNFLMLPRQRNAIFLLAFHYPRLVMSTFLPSFSSFLLKRPPYLREFAGKSNSKEIRNMLDKAEERFVELIPPNWRPNPHTGELQHPAVLRHTYVISGPLHWQGMLSNPLPSFWSDDLSCVWKGRQVQQPKGEPDPKVWAGIPGLDLPRSGIMGWSADDPEKKLLHPVTAEMANQSVKLGGIDSDGSIKPDPNYYGSSGYVVMEHKARGIRWIKQVY